jgi:hypothetical protein
MTNAEKKAIYAALAKPFDEHCIQRTEGWLNGRGYDTTVGLIRLGGHQPCGGYGVQHGRREAAEVARHRVAELEVRDREQGARAGEGERHGPDAGTLGRQGRRPERAPGHS